MVSLTPRRLMIVINPKAGVVANKGADSLILTEARRLTYSGIHGADSSLHYLTDVRYTRSAGHATLLAREAVEKGYYGILACGGDGTVNEVARGICGSDVAMGVIPLGSGNGLARHLGVPMTIPGAMKVIAEDRVLRADYATANDRPFFCTFGVGFDAEVTEKFNNRPGRGFNNYIRTVMEEYFKYKAETYTIIADGLNITERALLVAVCNASQYGNNAYIAPHASITDGLLDITIVHSGTPIDTAVMGMDIFTGYINKNTMVHSFRAPAAVIYRSSAGEAHIDGEPIVLDSILDIKCRRGQLKIFTPDNRADFRPIITPVKEMLRDARLGLHHLFSRHILAHLSPDDEADLF